MQIIVLTDEVRKEEFKIKNLNVNVEVIFAKDILDITNYQQADAYFILKEINKKDLNIREEKPVFLNSTIETLKQLGLPENFIRINGWATFLKREIWEVATTNENIVKDIFNKLEWKYITVADEPGMVSARIIAMIINEAYFALGDNVSSKDEIDIAMKSGTNYPYGPFEWSKKIGLKNIYSLLEKLSITDSRYNIAPAMKNEILNN